MTHPVETTRAAGSGTVTSRLSAVAPARTVLTIEHRGLADLVACGAG